MRGSVLLLASVIAGTFLAFVPTGQAVATCDAAREIVLGKECPDLVCYGYTGGQWQTCLPPDPTVIDLCKYMDNCVILDE